MSYKKFKKKNCSCKISYKMRRTNNLEAYNNSKCYPLIGTSSVWLKLYQSLKANWYPNRRQISVLKRRSYIFPNLKQLTNLFICIKPLMKPIPRLKSLKSSTKMKDNLRKQLQLQLDSRSIRRRRAWLWSTLLGAVTWSI